MNKFHDQTGKTVFIQTPPRRIISVVPSQTELLAYLGLHQEVIGITKFCVHPAAWFQSKIKVGGTKQLKIDLIQSLQPDLVIANKEENVKEQIEAIEQFCPVWTSDVTNLATAFGMIKSVAGIMQKGKAANQLLNSLTASFSNIIARNLTRAVYLIWKKPYMTVGGDTFIHHMMLAAGFENVFAIQNRYPVITVEDIRNAGCEVILLSSEPYPFQQKHIAELQKELPHVKIILADGELFSWYGSRMLYAASYFEKLKESLFL